MPEYRAIQFIRQNYHSEVILQMQAGSALTYIRNNQVVGDWFGQYRYLPIIRAFIADVSAGRQDLTDKGVTLILANREFIQQWPLFADALASLESAYEDETTVLYRLQEQVPVGRPPG